MPKVIDEYLAILDDPTNYPILIHCKAGLHRTGVFAAVYRMEYNGWSKQAALQEIRDLGFGELACTPDNDYIREYILSFTPGRRQNSDQRSAISDQPPAFSDQPSAISTLRGLADR